MASLQFDFRPLDPEQFGVRLLTMLGLQDSHVSAIDIHIRPAPEPVTIEVHGMVGEQFEAFDLSSLRLVNIERIFP